MRVLNRKDLSDADVRYHTQDKIGLLVNIETRTVSVPLDDIDACKGMYAEVGDRLILLDERTRVVAMARIRSIIEDQCAPDKNGEKLIKSDQPKKRASIGSEHSRTAIFSGEFV